MHSQVSSFFISWFVILCIAASYETYKIGTILSYSYVFKILIKNCIVEVFIIKKYVKFSFFFFKGPLPGLRQCLATKNFLKMMENTFYFTLKALFVLKMFKSLY